MRASAASPPNATGASASRRIAAHFPPRRANSSAAWPANCRTPCAQRTARRCWNGQRPDRRPSPRARRASTRWTRWRRCCRNCSAARRDLTASNLTNFKGCTRAGRDTPGNHLSYGVREFAMAAMMNGMALHGGHIPYGGTFLTFSDYSRNAIRMAALMKLRVIHVLTHDSIGLGEDGPTHQSVEHVPSLRLIPNLDVWRPCDALETAVAWACAVERADGPSALCLSRQNLPRLVADAARAAEDPPRRLRAVRHAGRAGGDRRDGLRSLAGDRRPGRTGAGRHRHPRRLHALHEPLRPRAAGLAGRRAAAWRCRPWRWKPRIRTSGASTWAAQGAVIGIASFGESAPAKDLYTHFGITTAAHRRGGATAGAWRRPRRTAPRRARGGDRVSAHESFDLVHVRPRRHAGRDRSEICDAVNDMLLRFGPAARSRSRRSRTGSATAPARWWPRRSRSVRRAARMPPQASETASRWRRPTSPSPTRATAARRSRTVPAGARDCSRPRASGACKRAVVTNKEQRFTAADPAPARLARPARRRGLRRHAAHPQARPGRRPRLPAALRRVAASAHFSSATPPSTWRRPAMPACAIWAVTLRLQHGPADRGVAAGPVLDDFNPLLETAKA